MSAFHLQTLCVKYEHIIIPFAQNSNTYFSLNIIRLVDGFQFPESIDLDNIVFLTFSYFYLVMLLAEYQWHLFPVTLLATGLSFTMKHQSSVLSFLIARKSEV